MKELAVPALVVLIALAVGLAVFLINGEEARHAAKVERQSRREPRTPR